MLSVVETPEKGKEKPVVLARFNTASEAARAAKWLNELVAKSQTGIIAQVATVGPALASVLIERNTGNRKVKTRRVEDFTRDMLGGNWKLNGEPIIVSRDGVLNDGQHRCLAVLEAKVEVPMMLVVGVLGDTRDTIDHGVGRSPADDLALHGHVNTIQLAAAGRLLWQWREYGLVTYSGHRAPTRIELMQTVDGSPGLAKSLLEVNSKGSRAKAVTSTPALAFCHFAFKTVAPETDVAYFFDALIEGANLKRGDPILNARNRLIAERGLLKTDMKIELLFRAWNAHRNGETSRVAFRLSGGKLPMLEA